MPSTQSLPRRIINKLRRLPTQLLGENETTPQVPTKYVNTLRHIEACTGSLNGKSILEVGSDPAGRFMSYLSRERNIGRGVGINPCIPEEKTFGNIELRKYDARKIPLPDNQFDLITSTSVLEHVSDLDVAMAEMYRVLRPGGYMWAGLGPIWSSCWGHHLWIDSYRGQTVNWRTHVLPPYGHLLMTEPEMKRWCDEKFSDKALSEKIVEFVFHSEEQNRLFFSDYERIVRESSFETVFFVGVPDVPLQAGYECDESATIFRELASRYPDKSGFGYHLVWTLLFKREDAD